MNYLRCLPYSALQVLRPLRLPHDDHPEQSHLLLLHALGLLHPEIQANRASHVHHSDGCLHRQVKITPPKYPAQGVLSSSSA